jgi:hypothetical protein
MNIPLLLQFIATAIMIIGIIFGIQNIRQYQASRKRESAIVMLNSFQTSEFVRGLLYIFDLPDNAGKAEVDALPEDRYVAVYMVLGAWERLGILVFRGEVELGLVEDAYGGAVLQSWQNLKLFVEEFRLGIQRESAFEWFQWLAERLQERETAAQPLPAYLAHKDWKAR